MAACLLRRILTVMKHRLKIVFGLVLFVGFSLIIYRTSVFRISQNFAVVEDGRLFRSAQLKTNELEEIIKMHGIKTVISLRGWPGKTAYYDAEAETLARLNTQFLALDLDDKFYPPEKELKKLFTAFENGDYPMLIHCRVGADRTGMVAALYQQVYMKKTVTESLQQLTFKYWHVPLFKPAMSAFVKKFKGINWALNDYHTCDPEFSSYREVPNDCKN